MLLMSKCGGLFTLSLPCWKVCPTDFFIEQVRSEKIKFSFVFLHRFLIFLLRHRRQNMGKARNGRQVEREKTTKNNINRGSTEFGEEATCNTCAMISVPIFRDFSVVSLRLNNIRLFSRFFFPEAGLCVMSERL